MHQWCEPEGMSFDEIDQPQPGPQQVRIKNHAAGLNFFDVLQVQGKYQVKPPFPFTPGAEIAGEVDAVGSEVSTFRPGDKVIALPMGSTFAEQTLALAQYTYPLPPGMSWEQAAAMPIVYHTSYYALRDRGNLQPGEWLLVHAGASGVGMSAIQLGKVFGARVIATAGSQGKLDFARKQGAEHALNYNDSSWADRVKEITDRRGADVIYDPVGGDAFDLSSKCIASGGRLLVIGFASGRIPSIAANRILFKNMAVIGVFWGGQLRGCPDYCADTQRALSQMWSEGKIKPEVSRTYPLAEATKALRDLSDRRIIGKAVLQI